MFLNIAIEFVAFMNNLLGLVTLATLCDKLKLQRIHLSVLKDGKERTTGSHQVINILYIR